MRLPIAIDMASRDGTTAKDAGCRNSVIEVSGESSALIKRPGALSLGAVGTGLSQLLACYNGELKSLVGNTLADLIVTEALGYGSSFPAVNDSGWSGLAFGNGVFVAISGASGIPVTSTDGMTWNVHPQIDVSGVDGFNRFVDGSLAFGNGVFVVTCDPYCRVFTSTDGINWTDTGWDVATGENVVSFVGTKFVLMDGGIQSNVNLYTSDNGSSWSNHQITHGYPGGTIVSILSTAYFSGKYYVLMADILSTTPVFKIAYSSNLASWSVYYAPLGYSPKFKLTASGPNLVHAGLAYSTDGLTWTASTGIPPSYSVLTDVISFNGSLYTMVLEPSYADPLALYSSSDNGASWSKHTQYGSGVDYYSWGATDGSLVVFLSDSFDKITVAAGSVPASSYVVTVNASTPVISIVPSLPFFAEVAGQAQSQNVMFLKNEKEAWTYDGTTLAKIADPDYPGWSTVTPASVTRSGSTATIALSSPVNWQSGSLVTIAGAAQAEYNGTVEINVTDSTHATYQVTGTPVTPATGTITAKGGRTTVPGIVYLDGYFFVMDRNAVIYNCALGDPTSWSALDFITANIEPGSGVAIAKAQNYIIALKSWSTEFFYDAGNAVGSPLSPVMNAFTLIGCASGDSVANIDGTIAWVSKTRQKGRAVHIMAGLDQQKVSTPDIERILNADTMENVYSYGVKISGHTFYVLGLKDSGLTLVYDFTSQSWAQWTSLTAQTSKSCTIVSADGMATVTCNAHGYADGDPVTIAGAAQAEYNGTQQIRYVDANTYKYAVAGNPATPATGAITATGYTETYFKYTKYVYCAGRDLVLHETTGELCEITESVYQDSGKPINFMARTGKIDGDSIERKTNSQLKVIGNKIGGIAMVRWSDDDYTTNAAFRPIDLSSEQARLSRLGSFRRRSYELRHVGNSPVQVSALELDIQQEK